MTDDLTYTGPELCALEAHEVVALLKKREVSPDELIDAAMARIGQVDGAVNAMPTTCPDRARKAAADLDDRNKDHPGWLAGLPIGIKDLNPVAGVRTTWGTKGRENFIPEKSDAFVELLESRGAVVVGMTTSPEMGAGGNTFSEVYGRTRNPWNTEYNPAGSSGGAAVSLATGEVWLSHGSDNAGSLRTPAAYCGVVGMRPSPHRVAVNIAPGVSAGYLIEGQQGPMARSVTDCALFFDAMTGFDRRHPLSYPAPETSCQEAVAQATPKIRIAFSPDLQGICPVEPVIAEALAAAMTQVEAAGAVVEEACPDLTGLKQTYDTIRAFGYAVNYDRTPEAVSRHFKQTIQQNIAAGRALTVQDLVDAQIDRTTIFANTERFLRDFDVIACPTVGCMPRASEEEWISEINGQTLETYTDWLAFAFLSTTTGLPSISVPVGLSADGLPIGVQLIGPPRGEAKLLAAARAVEMAVGAPAVPIDPVVTHL